MTTHDGLRYPRFHAYQSVTLSGDEGVIAMQRHQAESETKEGALKKLALQVNKTLMKHPDESPLNIILSVITIENGERVYKEIDNDYKSEMEKP